jgi:hypothetical protein
MNPRNNLITDGQFGFMPGKSFIHQLYIVMNHLELKKRAAMLLESVDHILLYRKLKTRGLREEWRP